MTGIRLRPGEPALLLSAAVRHVEADLAFLDDALETLTTGAAQLGRSTASASSVEDAGGRARRRRSA